MPTAGKGTYRELLRQGEHLLRRRVHPAPCDDAATDAFLLLEKVRCRIHDLPACIRKICFHPRMCIGIRQLHFHHTGFSKCRRSLVKVIII